MRRKWDIASDEVQRKCVDEVIARIDEIGDAVPGIVAAQDIIDIVTENLAPSIYNAGLHDARKAIVEGMDSIDADIEALKIV